MSESEQTKMVACWETFKAEREVACLKQRIDLHVAATRKIADAWENGGLYALSNGMLQERADGSAVQGYLGSDLSERLRDYQDAVQALEEKRKAFQALLS